MFSRPWFAPIMVILSALSGYVGAAFAVDLFAFASAPSVAWGRMAIAAVIFLAWRRPWRLRDSQVAGSVGRNADARRGSAAVRNRGALRPLQDYRAQAAFGLLLAGVTVSLYLSIELIPMGASVAIQFLGPISIAVALGKGWRIRAAVALAMGGVFLISFAGLDLSAPGAMLGLFYTVVAGAFWAGYIVAGKKVAESGSGLDTLAIGFAVASIVTLPFAHDAIVMFVHPPFVGTLVAVAILSTVVTYIIDQVVLPHVPASTYALLTALSPATSLLVGVIMLQQIPSMGEFVGLLLVSGSVLLATNSSASSSDAQVSADDEALALGGDVPTSVPAENVAIDVVAVAVPEHTELLGVVPPKKVLRFSWKPAGRARKALWTDSGTYRARHSRAYRANGQNRMGIGSRHS